LVEAIVWPMKEAERFKKIGIKAPKGSRWPSLFTSFQTNSFQVL
jgi:26S proteasome regulatory subunit T5